MITDKKAEELEQRGLWRRAAARWQELLLNYLQEDDRICIQRRIQHCLKRAKMKSQRATSQEEFSFRLLRSSAIQTEKEMGIYRDRKTAHDHWICPYISRHLLSLNPLLACCRRYSRGER